MLQGCHHAQSGFFLGREPPEPIDVLCHIRNRIDGTSQAMGDLMIEHGKVVVVITRRKGEFRSNSQQPADFHQGTPLVVAMMGKSEPDAIPLISQGRPGRELGIDPTADSGHDLIVRHYDACRLGFIRDKLGAWPVGGQVLLQLLEENRVVFEEFLVGLGTTAIPISKIHVTAIFILVVNFRFAGNQKIRSEPESVLIQSIQGMMQSASGIDAPNGPTFPHVGENLLQLRDFIRIAGMVHERTIKIETKNSVGRRSQHEKKNRPGTPAKPQWRRIHALTNEKGRGKCSLSVLCDLLFKFIAVFRMISGRHSPA